MDGGEEPPAPTYPPGFLNLKNYYPSDGTRH